MRYRHKLLAELMNDLTWMRIFLSWWCHQMETFSALLAFCAGNSPVTGEFPTQRTVTRSFDVFFDLRLNKRLSKQSWGWWFETLSWSLWCHCNAMMNHIEYCKALHLVFQCMHPRNIFVIFLCHVMDCVYQANIWAPKYLVKFIWQFISFR